jgi:hypothetical protein
MGYNWQEEEEITWWLWKQVEKLSVLCSGGDLSGRVNGGSYQWHWTGSCCTDQWSGQGTNTNEVGSPVPGPRTMQESDSRIKEQWWSQGLQHVSWLFSLPLEVSEKAYGTLFSPRKFRVTTQKNSLCIKWLSLLMSWFCHKSWSPCWDAWGVSFPIIFRSFDEVLEIVFREMGWKWMASAGRRKRCFFYLITVGVGGGVVGRQCIGGWDEFLWNLRTFP